MAFASVSLPASLFPPNAPPDCKLQFVAFRNGRFFPFTSNFTGHSDLARRRGVNTPVIYVGLGGLPSAQTFKGLKTFITFLQCSGLYTDVVQAFLEKTNTIHPWNQIFKSVQQIHSFSEIKFSRAQL